MFKSLDHLIIAVEDLEKATYNYQLIMGTPPVWTGMHKSLGTSNALFNFQNTYLENMPIHVFKVATNPCFQHIMIWPGTQDAVSIGSY